MASGDYLQEEIMGGDIQFSSSATPTNGGVKRRGEDMGIRVFALRTRSEEDIMDDGFKWRKYGKKKIKSNPVYPRNYYRCSSRGCQVKKRVERDRDDSSCVITTYEGVHIHPTPRNHITLPINHWALQQTSSHSPFY
ncbi:probable WRKY transcription factor 43 [Vitis riparia]|uniref:probable WRKY transcription factor 43 n=1 Tax=Vitis riparia TaxID=96939 RepID=UPI00155AD62F|nr:probable WRKY transcription factor 43 [Vitis riparia]